MQFLLVLCFVIFALGPKDVMGSLGEQIGEISNKCCSVGDAYARAHDARDCTSSVPPEVPLAFSTLCQLAMDQCCQDFRHKVCAEGIEMAKTSGSCKSSHFAQKELGEHCCQQCQSGATIGSEGGECSLESSEGSTEDSLIQGAFEKCCSSQRDSRNVSEIPHTVSQKPSIASICEEYAPNELCAHHCIPIPGSYRCECNPGYKLMSDKKNCMELVKNRCKPKNPCHHKCNDNGVNVKCSCRRGYQLKADGKSCEDIDECKLNLCLPGTECQNYLGYYKCIPVKKNQSTDQGQCPAGFMRNPTNDACDDINECDLPRPPCLKYLCENTVGGYKCAGVAGDPGNFSANPAPLSTVEDRCPPGFKSGIREECEDVDECSTNHHDCNQQSQSCINTIGSFYCQDKGSKHCPPGFKPNATTNNCEDVDECQDSHFLCPVDKICVNVPGGYDCKPKYDLSRSTTKCPDGMRINPGSPYCQDIDECLEGTHLCDQYQSCLNTNGSHECRCKIGFEPDLTGACVDMNECATDQNNCLAESQRCDNTVGSYICVRFLSCGTGYILHHATGNCEDIDECALGQHNCKRAGPNYQCVNIPGSFRCVRQQPSTTSTTAGPEFEYEYYDSEETPETNSTKPEPVPRKPDTNQAPTTSSTTERSTTSTLPPTTSSFPTESPKSEQPKSEQPNSEQPPTNPKQPQQNNESQTPMIDLGEKREKELTTNEVKPTEEKNYYEPTQKIPEDNTSPHVVLLTPPEETVTFEAVRGEDGSLIVNTKDVPKNEWTNIVRKPERSCPSGFEPNGFGTCVDIDECATNRHVCSGLTEICRNSIGGYVCNCAPGFRRDLTTGACDLMTSSTSTSTTTTTTTSTTTSTTSTTTSTTETPTSSTTEGRFFGYKVYRPKFRPFKTLMLCDVGYHMNTSSGKCEDINECMNGVARCGAVEICVNTDGGYRCDCHPNWKYDESRHRCVPNRERGRFPSGYENVGHSDIMVSRKDDRINAVPTFTKYEGRGNVLQCRPGYTLGDDNTCKDIDECATGSANCDAQQICTNLPGGYVCACAMGYKLGDLECQDIDECALAGDRPICSEHADCVNTMGSYQCRCHEGFRSAPANDKVCMDIDECVESRAGSLCQHRCNNIWGSYRCSCHRGYRLNPDNRTCSDIDECTVFKSKVPCVGRCLNEPGGYKCACPSGYRLSQDKRSCIDIDECETGEAVCAVGTSMSGSNLCFNIRGGYRCEKITCLPGYRLENKHRCTKIDQLCAVGDWNCIHQPSTYSYHYITFVSKLEIPVSKVDLYTMSVPAWPNANTKFELRLVKVDAPPTVKEKAHIKSFLLTSTNKNAVVSIVQSLEGPQSIELELSMELYSGDSFAGIAVAKLFIFVSEYGF